MANRHLARSIALQTLYEWDFGGMADANIGSILQRNKEEFAPGMGDFSFVEKLVRDVVGKREKLDEIIVKAAPDWPIEKISVVDRNILRIGLFELLFADKIEVPAKVAINEAIELAKTFGGENSGKFVNGVLGSVYKELGEPGKDAFPKKKQDVPFEKMLVQKLGGAVVYARDGADIYMAFVHDIFGHWTLSKGKIEAGEDVKSGTVREIKEEMGVDIEIKEELGQNEYIASDPEKGKIRKQVNYFLAEAKYENLKLGKSGGLDDARWFKLADVVDLNFYSDTLAIITKAVNILLRK
ncbi:MAG: transcription antitermination factor NusB [Candidatus Paceibacterota bacterium]|jgi:N utilization substance protein B